MAIPPFEASGVLPQWAGDIAAPAGISPYKTDVLELVQRFAGSAKRRDLLKGLLRYRGHLRSRLQMLDGFQWIDGSFVESLPPPREPNDIDVVTFAALPSPPTSVSSDDVELAFERTRTKGEFHCDGFVVNLGGDAAYLIERAVYWSTLFSNRRSTGERKGLVEVSLDGRLDAQALTFLDQAPS